MDLHQDYRSHRYSRNEYTRGKYHHSKCLAPIFVFRRDIQQVLYYNLILTYFTIINNNLYQRYFNILHTGHITPPIHSILVMDFLTLSTSSEGLQQRITLLHKLLALISSSVTPYFVISSFSTSKYLWHGPSLLFRQYLGSTS